MEGAFLDILSSSSEQRSVSEAATRRRHSFGLVATKSGNGDVFVAQELSSSSSDDASQSFASVALPVKPASTATVAALSPLSSPQSPTMLPMRLMPVPMPAAVLSRPAEVTGPEAPSSLETFPPLPPSLPCVQWHAMAATPAKAGTAIPKSESTGGLGSRWEDVFQ